MQDVENAYFTLMWQLVQKLKPLVVMPERSYKTLQRCAEARDEIIENELQLPKCQGKQILLEIVNGGSPPEELASKEVLVDLQQVSLWLKWLAMTNLPELHDHCEKTKTSPENSIVAYLYQSIEDLVLTSWIGYLSALDLTHLSLHFDGVRVEGRRSINIEEICRHSEDWIGKETGFNVNIKEKKHMLFQELLAHRGELSSVVDLDPIFKESRNCILACLAYLTGKQVAIEEWLSKQHVDDESGAPQWRSYKACFLAAQLSGVPVVGCEARETGKYILHCEHDGLPLAIGCVTEADSCKVFFATGVVLTMSAKTLHDCADECVDASSLVTFALGGEDELSENKCLLELQAGCRLEVDALGGAEAGLCECEAEMEDSDDEGVAGADCPEAEVRVGDSLLVLLAQERSKALQQEDCISDGSSFRCPFCPFRKFSRGCRVMEHIRKYHQKKRQFCCSGTKQLRVVQALFDDDQLKGLATKPRYLRRSAAVLRNSLGSMNHAVNHLDRAVRLVLTEKGPVYKPVSALTTEGSPYRRARNLFYTHGFADHLFQEMLVCHAKMKQVSCHYMFRHKCLSLITLNVM